MTHDGRQPTLREPSTPPPVHALTDLTLVEAATLLAFVRSTDVPAPVSPHPGFTQALARWLEQRGVLALLTDTAAMPGTARSVQRAIYDAIRWRYVTDALDAAAHRDALVLHLRTLSRSADAAEAKLTYWRLLADAELESYLAHLLRRHGLDAGWASAIRDEPAPWKTELSLGQMRYVVWATVREAAATYLREWGDPEATRGAIALELRRRARWLLNRAEPGFCFLPPHTVKRSLMLEVFLEHVAPIGDAYWTSVSSASALG